MKYCETDFKGDELWCETHELVASHCAPNGDDLVCEKYANAEGCNCCRKNWDRGKKNDALYKAAWDRLSPEDQAALKRQLEGSEEN